MKNRIQFDGKMTRWVVALAVVFTGFAMTGCDNDNDNKTPVDNREYTISGNADNSQVVSTDSTGDTTAVTGTGSISGKYNPSTRVLTYTTTWTGLTGPPISAGFFNSASGSAGPAVGAPFTIDAAATGTGSTSGTMTITEEQSKQLLSNYWYYSIATVGRPGGEIRGQVTAER